MAAVHSFEQTPPEARGLLKVQIKDLLEMDLLADAVGAVGGVRSVDQRLQLGQVDLDQAVVHGSVVGAQFGSKIGAKLPAEYTRALLATIVLGVALKLAFGLFTPPTLL